MNLKQIKTALFKPIIKTIVFILSVVVSGVLCSGFILEISNGSSLIWSNFYKVKTFYLILLLSVIIYFYNKFIYKTEMNILKYVDNDYCRAYIRSQCIPEIVEQYKKSIHNGKNSSELKEYHSELKRLLK